MALHAHLKNIVMCLLSGCIRPLKDMLCRCQGTQSHSDPAALSSAHCAAVRADSRDTRLHTDPAASSCQSLTLRVVIVVVARWRCHVLVMDTSGCIALQGRKHLTP
jgi:hypothetical protein